jgi:hydroxymethylglutaryl-CoA reductase
MSIDERVKDLEGRGFLDSGQADRLLAGEPLLSPAAADRMSENVIGVFGLPFCVAPNFVVDGKDYLVPMVIEEPSVVAGVSGAARLFRDSGGFTTAAEDALLIGQVQLTGMADPDEALRMLAGAKNEFQRLADASQPRLVERGGGVREIEIYKHELPDGRWSVVLHLLVDTCDAMGANVVNAMCETLAPRVEKVGGGKVVLRILSNLADRAVVTVRGRVAPAALATGEFPGDAVRDAIVLADQLAQVDPYRATTHNKGIMNGVDALAIATGNDWRAIEAGAHAYAARSGLYRALTRWQVAPDGWLEGEMSLPLKIGVVGASLQANPGAMLGLSIAGVTSARELAGLMAATGLAQNFAALRALAAAGIQQGHMRLHARSVAATAGVPEKHFDAVVAGLIDSGEIKLWKAAEIAEALCSAEEDPATPHEACAEGVAAGKVILLGEHAVVYGREALALPIEAAISATVSEKANGIRLTVADWDIEEHWEAGKAPTDGAAPVIDRILQALGVGGRGLDIRVASRIPIAMGLGSSAAFAVAVIRALDAYLGLGQDDAEIDALAFRCEELTHGTPSGVDNHLATFGRAVRFRRGERVRPLELSAMPPLVVAASGIRGITRDQVAGVRARYERSQSLYEGLFDEMGRIAGDGAQALIQGNYERLGELMNVCHGLLNAIGVSHPELEKMVSIARQSGALGAKLTGAGGGGSIVALCPGKVREVSSALRGAGYAVIPMQVGKD